MSSVAYLTAPTVPAGSDCVHARQLDALLKAIVDRINQLIAALNVMRDGDHAWIKERSVRWRMFSEDARRELRVIIAALKTMRQTRRIIYSVFDPQLDFTLLPWPDFQISGSQYTWFKHSMSMTTGWYTDTVPPLATSLVELVYWNRAMMEAAAVRPASWPVSQWLYDHTYLPTGFFADDRLFMVDRTMTNDHLDVAVVEYDHIRAELIRSDNTTQYEWILNGVFVPQSAALTYYNPWPTQVIAEQLGWAQSSKFTAVARPGWTFRIQYRNDDHNGIFSSETAYPPDSDPRFPYLIRHRDAVGWQFELLRIRKLPENRAPITLITQTGGWLEGAGPCGFLEVEDHSAASY